MNVIDYSKYSNPKKNKKSAFSKWDWGWIITFLAIVSVFLGNILVKIDISFFQLYPLRLFGFIGFFLIILRIGWADPFLDFYYKFSLFFLILGLASIIWSPDTDLAIKEFGVLQTGITLSWLVIRHVNSEDRLNTILYIWIVGALFVNLIGLYEVISQKYLIATEVGDKAERLMNRVGSMAPRSIFNNQNNYAFFNSLTSLILLGKLMKQYRPLIWYLLNWVSLGLSVYLLVCSYSRAAISGSALGTMLFIFFTIISHNTYKQNLLKLAGFLFIGFIAILILNGSILDSFVDKVYLVVEKNEVSTDNSRVDIYNNSLNYSLDHLGIGMGPGSSIIPSDGIPPHNFFLLILVEYGILIVLGLIFIFFKSFKRLGQYQHVISNGMPPMLKASILAFPLMAVGPSSIMLEGIFWLWFGLLIALSSIMYRKNRSLYIATTQMELTKVA